MLRALACLLLLGASLARAADYPTPVERDWIARDFRFHAGEVMPELRLHVTTIGSPSGEPVLDPARHRQLGGVDARSGVRRRAVRPGPAARRKQVLHHPSRRDRHRQVGQAIRRPAHEVPALRLRRHGRGAVSPRQRRPRRSPPAPGASAIRWAACMPGSGAFVIRNSWTRWCRWRASRPRWRAATGCCAGCWSRRSAAIRAGRAATTRRSRARWRLAATYFGIATSGGSLALYQAAPTREQADKLVDARLAAPFAADANDMDLSMVVFRRLQRFAGARAHRGAGAGDQLGRRRAQSARAEDHGARDAAREERRAST